MKSYAYSKFLCIGAQKAGTTWLFINLQMHPEIWLQPVKEVHYLNCMYRGKFVSWKNFRKKLWRESFFQSMRQDMVNYSYSNLL